MEINIFNDYLLKIYEFIMKKTKFDLLFENIISQISDKELYGSDVHNSILKIYRME